MRRSCPPCGALEAPQARCLLPPEALQASGACVTSEPTGEMPVQRPNAEYPNTPLPMLRSILARLGVVAVALPFFCLGAAALFSASRDAARPGERIRLVVWGTV